MQNLVQPISRFICLLNSKKTKKFHDLHGKNAKIVGGVRMTILSNMRDSDLQNQRGTLEPRLTNLYITNDLLQPGKITSKRSII